VTGSGQKLHEHKEEIVPLAAASEFNQQSDYEDWNVNKELFGQIR